MAKQAKIWTPEMEIVARRLWMNGASASVVAESIGVTRNAVIGKVHRMGLDRDPKVPVIRAPRSVVRRARPVVTVAPVVRSEQPAAPVVDEKNQPRPGVTLMDRTRDMCCWPLSDPGDEDFRYCGKQVVQGGRYCARHERKVYRPR